MPETKLYVELISHTKDPEKLIAAAAKLCYSKSDIRTLLDGLTVEKIDTMIKKLEEYEHESPFEHVSYSFGVEGVSRALTHQLVRHRIASYSQQSQRYVNMNNFFYIVPFRIAQNTEAKQRYDVVMDFLCKEYETITNILIKEGYDEKEAIEDARYILPNACESKIILTMNIRSLLHFMDERCCQRAQHEIRMLANEVCKIVKTTSPRLFSKAGPKCFPNKKCTEGSMTCGQFNEVQKFYSSV